jgi:hypothetical protein
MEGDHWVLSLCRASVYTTREICGEDHLDGLRYAKNKTNLTFEENDEDDWEEHGLQEGRSGDERRNESWNVALRFDPPITRFPSEI